MTKDCAKYIGEILTAYASGLKLECTKHGDGIWYDWSGNLELCHFDKYDRIRIKPEKKTSRIPLSREDILDRSKLGFEAMWITDNGKDYSLIVGISHDGVYRRTGFITFREMMQRYTFSLDGTPCYKEVESE